MLRQAMVIVIALSLAVQPARAATPAPADTGKRDQPFCTAFVGIDDVMFLVATATWLIFAVAYYGSEEKADKLKRENDELKAKAKHCN